LIVNSEIMIINNGKFRKKIKATAAFNFDEGVTHSSQ